MFRNLLVPLDGSRLAESVLPVVRRLAERIPCAVKLLHVIEKRPPTRIHGDTHLQDMAGAERYIAAIAQNLKDRGLNVSSHVHTVPQGDIPKCIAEHAEELEQDLIVLCSHGSGGFKRFVFGTNAEQVVEHGRTPVALVQTDANGRAPDFGPAGIVALLDNTPESDAVLTACAELAMIFDAGLHLVWVVPTAGSIRRPEAPGGRLAPGTTRLLLDLEAEEAAERLKKEVQALLARNIDVTGTIARGKAGPAVVKIALKRHADMMAMATRGLAGLGAFLSNNLVPEIASDYNGVLLLFPAGKE